MWKIEIVKSTKHEVIGSDDARAQHIVDTSNLPTRPKVGDHIFGYKAGGAIIAERFATENKKSKYSIGTRFALKRDFEALPNINEQPRFYPAGSAFKVIGYGKDDTYWIVAYQDERENPSSRVSYNVTEHLIDTLLTDPE